MSSKILTPRVVALGVMVALSAGLGSSVAYAATATYSGSRANNTSLVTLTSQDTADDGLFVKAEGYSNYGSNVPVVNKLGFNTSVTSTIYAGTEKMTKIRACRANTGLQPMTCGAWVTA